jgi:hypothetical protein
MSTAFMYLMYYIIMSPEIIHSLILIAAIAASSLLAKTPLAQYDLQIIAGLFIILFIGKRINNSSIHPRLMESVIFTLVVMIIIDTTGGATSPFFFLIYFLLFSLSLLLEPVIAITTTFTLIVFLLLSLPENQEIKSLLPIISLAFLTPFAMFLGEEMKKNKKLSQTIVTNQEETFLFLSLMIKNHLKSIKTSVENFVGDHELSQIKHHTKAVEKLIEKFENSN